MSAALFSSHVMESNQRIEKQNARPQSRQGRVQTLLIASQIETQARGNDREHVEIVDVQTAPGAQRLDPRPHGALGVLGHENQGGSRLPYFEMPEAWRARGHADRYVDSEPRFAAFRGAAYDADGAFRPDRLDQPGLLRRLDVQFARSTNRQHVFAYCHSIPLAPVTWLQSTTSQFCSCATWRDLRHRWSVTRKLPRAIS